MGKLHARLCRGLILYIRHLAWLNATPKPDPRSRRAKTEDASKRVSRLEKLKKDGITPPMPPNPAPQIIDRLMEIGLTEAAGMGSGPISWGAIRHWQFNTGVDLPAWEARLIRRLSSEYIAEGHKAEEEGRLAPWQAYAVAPAIVSEDDALRAMLG